jgi:hypothetical protein
MHDYSASGPDATDAGNAPGTYHGIRVSRLDHAGFHRVAPRRHPLSSTFHTVCKNFAAALADFSFFVA